MPSLTEKDYHHLWHPYSNIAAYERGPHVSIERAEGVYLYDTRGRAILDGIASWWCIALGHGQPHVIEAVQQQAARLQHSILGTLAHGGAVELAYRLAKTAPGDLNHVYFAADGSSAIEAALKMAVQFWSLQGKPEKNTIIGVEHGYHGDTSGAMSVGRMPWFHPYAALLAPALQAQSPWCVACDPAEIAHAEKEALSALEQLLSEHQTRIAAFIIEPLCQAAAGIKFHSTTYVHRAAALCRQYDVLFIADEIAVGYNRMGRMFASEACAVVPDIICIGKAMTAGYLPMSAALATDRLYDVFRRTPEATFYDGHTFGGNPITAAAALATLDVFEQTGFLYRPSTVSDAILKGEKSLWDIPGVCSVVPPSIIPKDAAPADTIFAPAIAACRVNHEAGGVTAAQSAAAIALENGLFTRPLGDVLYLWPPLTTTRSELKLMFDILADSISVAIVRM